MAPDPHPLSRMAPTDPLQEPGIQILQTTMHIRLDYPELSKYLEEMTVTLPTLNDPEISSRVLQDYAHSLKALVQQYAGATVIKEHPSDID